MVICSFFTTHLFFTYLLDTSNKDGQKYKFSVYNKERQAVIQ